MIALATVSARTSPYQGLRYYAEEDADFFFGRERERDVVVANLKASRLTVLYGPSGVGKTSLLRAGVAARLRALAQADVERLGSAEYLPVVFSAWQDDPGSALAHAIVAEVERMTGHAISPAPSLADTLMAAAHVTDASLLVILDQFEDFFLYHGGDGSAGSFVAQFPALVQDRRLPVSFLISIREDAIARLDRFKDSIPGLLETRLRVVPLTGQAAREAVSGPIARYNERVGPEDSVAIEDQLIDAVLEEVEVGKVRRRHAGQGLVGGATSDAGGKEDAREADSRAVEASYLQLVMSRIWEREMSSASTGNRARALRLATLRELGGADTIVREHLDDALDGLSPGEREAAAQVFQYLVTPSGTKVTQGLGTLVAWSGQSSVDVNSVLSKLEGDARIVRPVPPEPGTDEPRYEIFHDVLAEAILEWSAGESDRRRLGELGRENARLAEEKERAERQAATERRRRLLAVGLALLALAGVVAAVVFALTAASERNRARRESARAAYAGLTTTARSLLASRPDISLLLALQAYLNPPRGSSPALAEGTLVAALQKIQASGATGILHGHLDTVTSVAFADNADLLASASGDHTIRLWNPQTLRQVGMRTPPGGAVFSVAFRPRGNILASAHQNGDVRLWNARTLQPIGKPIAVGKSATVSVAFSPDGRQLAAANLSGTIKLWQLGPGGQLTAPRRRRDPLVRSIAFSANSKTLAAAGPGETGGQGRVRLLSVATLHRLGRDLPTPQPLYSVAFSHKGGFAAAGLSGIIYVGHPGDTRLTGWPRKGRAIESIAFDPTGDKLAVVGADETVEIWNAGTKKLETAFKGHTSMVTSVAFRTGRVSIASGSTDGTIRLWTPSERPSFERTLASAPLNMNMSAVAVSPTQGRLAWAAAVNRKKSTIVIADSSGHQLARIPTHYGSVRSLAFSPDGRRLLSASSGGSVGIWHVPSGRPDGPAIPTRVAINDAVFDPRNGWVAIAGARGLLELGDPPTVPMRRLALPQASGDVFAVAFSHDGHILASGGTDKVIRLWSVPSGQPLRVLPGHTDSVYALAFSPVSSLLASGSADDSIRLWRVSSSNPVTSAAIGRTFRGHTYYVRSVAFAPDGRTLVSGSGDDTVRLWDVRTGTQLGNTLGHLGYVNTVAFEPRGQIVATASRDGFARLLGPLGLTRNRVMLKKTVCGDVGHGLTPAEKFLYARDFNYRDPCELK